MPENLHRLDKYDCRCHGNQTEAFKCLLFCILSFKLHITSQKILYDVDRCFKILNDQKGCHLHGQKKGGS